MQVEEIIARIRKGWERGCTLDDMYDTLVLTEGLDEGQFFLCVAAAYLLEKDVPR